MKVRFYKPTYGERPWFVGEENERAYKYLISLHGWNGATNEDHISKALTIIETLCRESGEER